MRFGTLDSDDRDPTAPGRAGTAGASWARFDDVTAVWGDDDSFFASAESGPAGGRVHARSASVRERDLHLVVQVGRAFEREHPEVPVLLDKGRYLVVELPPERAESLRREEVCYGLRPLPAGVAVLDRVDAPARRAPVAWVQALVDQVSAALYRDRLEHLAAYPTRHSLSSHHEAAVTWARGLLDGMGYATRVEEVSVGAGTSRNLIADKRGSAGGDRDLVLCVAHLDSINQAGGASAAAPGADDNASGAAGLLEIARVLVAHQSAGDLRLILFGGEEQGLHGSTQYVTALPAGDRDRLAAVINMDMIATRNTAAPTVLLEGASVSQGLIDELAAAAATYTGLAVQTSLSPYASDHVPFIDAGLPAVLTIEGADSANANIHTAGDTLDHLDDDLAAEILRMNVAALASALGRKGTVVSTLDNIGVPKLDQPILESPYFLEGIRPWLRTSGKFVHNGGASAREAEPEGRDGHGILTDPSIVIDRPIYIDRPPKVIDHLLRPRFTLHIDVDGTDALGVVSGTVARGLVALGTPPPHFIGRVTSNSVVGGVRKLIVVDLSLPWPGSSRVIDCVEIELSGWLYNVSAEVTFVESGTGHRIGPYTAPRTSPYYREVEFEVDVESGAVDDVEPYDTHTHPDRPADLPREQLTLESVFAKSGIKATRSGGAGTVVDTSEAGADSRWSDQELHDAMEQHWSRFANVAQWKMWIFLARLGGSDSLGGIMFDGNIDEPGGVDRQGTVVFTRSPFFHAEAGDYPQANPPAAQAAQRELFFNLIHETGHAFNLAHSFQKTSGAPWAAPSWMPVTTDDDALSWMNYPERLSPGLSAEAFYDQFRFRFDDAENLFLRHAPESFVRMGDADWFADHGRVSRSSLDRRLELALRTRSATVAFGETVFVELRLRNVSLEPVMAHASLHPADGLVEIAVTGPDGRRRPFVPPVQARRAVRPEVLGPDERRYADVGMSVGMLGFPFKQPGHYRIEASYRNLDGGTAAAVLHVYVERPGSYDEERAVRSLFDAQTGLVMSVSGTRVLDDVNERLDWVLDRLGEEHPASYHLRAVRAMPLADEYKVMEPGEPQVRVLDPEPEEAVATLAPFVERPEEASDAVGHIAYREIVDTLTEAAVTAGSTEAARDAQQTMLGLFESREVVAPVVERVRARVSELR